MMRWYDAARGHPSGVLLVVLTVVEGFNGSPR